MARRPARTPDQPTVGPPIRPRIRPPARPARPRRSPARGASLVEFVVVVPTLLFIVLNLMQYGLLYHAKSQVNYAAFEAARAGSVANADAAAIRSAFSRAMTGYYGGGTTAAQLANAYARALADTTVAQARIEILSPSKESFDDYASPQLAERLKRHARVIPNTNLAYLDCPLDRPGCAKDPKTNASGQSLSDANLLKLRITWGIPPDRQLPLAGPFMNWALDILNPADGDAFRQGLVKAGRLPVVAHVVVRMQSPAIENGNASSPGAGNGGEPEDPGPGDPGGGLPPCPAGNPACRPEPQPPTDQCDPATDPDGCRPPGCQQGDPQCDPGCGLNYCCLLDKGLINPDGTPVNPAPTANPPTGN